MISKRTFAFSVVSDSLRPHGLLPRQTPLSMGFSRQEYWSELPFPTPGDLPSQGLKPHFLHCQAEPPGKAFSKDGAEALCCVQFLF